MTINYQLAELVQKIAGDVSERKGNLLRARGYFERFLKLLDSYDLLSKSDARLFETYSEDKDQFSTTQTRDAAPRREAKIARFKAEKELKRKLEVCHFRARAWSAGQQLMLKPVPTTEPQTRGTGRAGGPRAALD
jgi:hypothetical protein